MVSKIQIFCITGQYRCYIKNNTSKICDNYKYHIKAFELMPDHIHIFVDVPQTVAPCDIVRTLKSISAIELLKKYPQFCGQGDILF